MEKISENNKFIFYKNEFTGEKDGYKIIVAEEKKTGYKEYLLLEDDKPIYANQQIESIWYRIEALKLLKQN